MIFRVGLLFIHNHDRMSFTTRVLHATTWDYFISCLPDQFIYSPIVKEAIMTDITNDLVQEFWRTSSDGPGEASIIFAMRHLFKILRGCFANLKVRSDDVIYVNL